MKVYSDTILAYLSRARVWAKNIIEHELGHQFRRTRFQVDKYTWPLHLYVFEHPKYLGLFRPEDLSIGLNKCLIYGKKDQETQDILRHELAHYFMWIYYRGAVASHGPEFRDYCLHHGWNEDIYMAQATESKEELNQKTSLRNEGVINKIKKLLALSSSSNPHEAELATLKANELLLKHHLQMGAVVEEEYVVASLYRVGRLNTKIQCFCDLIKTFYVYPVLNYTAVGVELEVTGRREHIEVAQYVIIFLDTEFERLWTKETQLKGAKAKNSFFRGVTHGYLNRYENQVEKMDSSQQNALVLLKSDLKKKVQTFYSRLSGTGGTTAIDPQSFQLGQTQGGKLSINKGVSAQNSQVLRLN